MSKIKIKFSFLFLLLIMFFLNCFEKFILIFIFVSLHEFGHIIVGRIFSVKTEKVIITPVGETAIMKDIDNITNIKKFIIYMAGPLVNIIFGLIFFSLKNDFLANINFLIAGFNLLPIYPLDGGRVLILILNKFFPVMITNKIIFRLGIFFSLVFIFLGIIQINLFPYNMTLLCIGIYLFKIKYKMYFNMTFDFYKHIMKNKKNSEPIAPLKVFYLDEKFEIKKLLKNFYFETYSMFYVLVNNKFEKKLFEWDIINYIQNKGVFGNVLDVIKYKENYKK